jgi:hypothetical protein
VFPNQKTDIICRFIIVAKPPQEAVAQCCALLCMSVEMPSPAFVPMEAVGLADVMEKGG